MTESRVPEQKFPTKEQWVKLPKLLVWYEPGVLKSCWMFTGTNNAKEADFISAFCSKPKGICNPSSSPLKTLDADLLTVLSSSLSNFMSAGLQAYLADYENKLLRKRCFLWQEARVCAACTR